jgi:SAM-dependent methyltransferase
MSRDSGAGAYSQGIACPSPRPQLAGSRSSRRASVLADPSERFSSVSIAIAAIIASGLGAPAEPGPGVRIRAMERLSSAAELLDGPLDDPDVLIGNLRDLRRANRWLGGVALSSLAIDALVGRLADNGAAITLLDVGTGGADIPVALLADWRRRDRRLDVTAIDSRPEVLFAARIARPAIDRLRRLNLSTADGRSLPYPDDSFDVVHASLLLHHLDAPDAVSLLREMRRVSRHGVVVNDLQRARLFWWGARLLAAATTRNRYTRHDAPQSVARAYTIGEAKALLAVAGLRPIAETRGVFGHRWALAAVRA